MFHGSIKVCAEHLKKTYRDKWGALTLKKKLIEMSGTERMIYLRSKHCLQYLQS